MNRKICAKKLSRPKGVSKKKKKKTDGFISVEFLFQNELKCKAYSMQISF